ncbi:hypothetical protein EV06_1386 [Prochlorococcus sp. MIT 0602]|nr:hypothetical protein EV06_1386 [Prochlorococcus sp. MIT 0602]
MDQNEGDDLQNAKYSFCEEQGYSDQQFNLFDDSAWTELPYEFKVYAFNYCISDGSGYEEIKGLVTIDEITTLLSLEDLNNTLEGEGILLSEAEEEVMLLLEKEIKKRGRSVSEDDLYDATNNIINDLRDWKDDNHPDNLLAA